MNDTPLTLGHFFCYTVAMKKRLHPITTLLRGTAVPVIVEKDEDGFFVVECPLFRGCYTQGKTRDEALENIREVIALCLEEKENKERIAAYHPQELSMHTLTF